LASAVILAPLAGKAEPNGEVHSATQDSPGVTENLASQPPDLGAGKRVFQTNCAGCHGLNGEGGRGPTLAAPHLLRGSSVAAIIKIVTQGIHGTDMPPFVLGPGQKRDVAAWTWQLGQLPPEKVPGDPARGESLFRTRGSCMLCHSLHGYGGAIGPSLDDVGSRRGVSYLRRALTDPGAAVPQSYERFRPEGNITANFLQVSLVTNGGQTLTGVRINEDAFSIQVRDFANGFHSFQKSDLAELHKQWGATPMPSYASAFTAAEFDDLVAFLASNKGTR
jgi:cytochrome c oxidase cbb3-type subunit 3